ncbi:hypothetical protein [Azohydromonas australica]|uniref:hypothetical protein n=1 Tax=Azohydromonas australica TaxID=364039 RepID=UPI00041CC0EF|nr:hypothetical protein [Azohydromonas australica]
MFSKRIALVAMALFGSLGAGLAQAQGADVQWSVTIGAPVGVPVYNQGAPVHGSPMPATRPVPVRMPQGYQQPTRWDRDGDGIPNGRDHVFNPVWDRDGDGIANRHDRRDNLRQDHDGDGVPNWYDRSPWGRR